MKQAGPLSRVTHVYTDAGNLVRVVHPTRAEQLANLRRIVHGESPQAEQAPAKPERKHLSRAQKLWLKSDAGK